MPEASSLLFWKLSIIWMPVCSQHRTRRDQAISSASSYVILVLHLLFPATFLSKHSAKTSQSSFEITLLYM